MESKKKILLIDDDLLGSEIVKAALTGRGFEVKVLNDSREAAGAIAGEHPDLILLDILMPEVSGIEVLQEIRKTVSPIDLPVVMITSLDSSSDMAACLKLGANDYVTKPVDIEVAVARIRTQLTLVDLNKENVRKREIEALNAMIATYNHKINNALTIATMSLTPDLREMTQEQLDAVNESIEQIAEIVKHIAGITTGLVQVESYVGYEKMVKVK